MLGRLVAALAVVALAGPAHAQLDRVFTDEQRDAILDCIDEAQDQDLRLERIETFESGRYDSRLEFSVRDERDPVVCTWEDGRASLEGVRERDYGLGGDAVEEAEEECIRAVEDEGLQVVDVLATDDNEDHVSIDLRVREGEGGGGSGSLLDELSGELQGLLNGGGTDINCTYDGGRVTLREKN